MAGAIQGFAHELDLFDLLGATAGVQFPLQQAADCHKAQIGEFAPIARSKEKQDFCVKSESKREEASALACLRESTQHHRIGLLGPGVNPAGIFDAENLAAIVAAAQVGGARLELGIEIAARAVAADLPEAAGSQPA